MYNNPLQEALQQLNNMGKTSSTKNISETYTLNGKEIKISDPKNWKEEAPFAAVLGGMWKPEGVSQEEYEKFFKESFDSVEKLISNFIGFQLSVIYNVSFDKVRLNLEITDAKYAYQYGPERVLLTLKPIDFVADEDEIDPPERFIKQGYLKEQYFLMPSLISMGVPVIEGNVEECLAELKNTEDLITLLQIRMDKKGAQISGNYIEDKHYNEII